MERLVVQRALKEIQKEVGIDFVSYHYGHCCRSCADFRTRQDQWDSAKTILVGIHFLSGMNKGKSFEHLEELYFGWEFDITLMPKVVAIFEKYGFTVQAPKSELETIKIC